jgi:hypothetical protein
MVRDHGIVAIKSNGFHEFMEKINSPVRDIDCPSDRMEYWRTCLRERIDEAMETVGYDHQSEQNDCLPCSEQEDIEKETDEFDRVSIEWCCGRNSKLGQPSTYSTGCKAIRLTIDDDLRAVEGLENAFEIAKQCPRGKTLLWSSMPCAGGSPLQHISRARSVGQEKLEAHWRDFWLLGDHFEIVAIGDENRRNCRRRVARKE